MSADDSTRAQRDSLTESKARSGAGRAGKRDDALARYLRSVHYSSRRPGTEVDRRVAGRG